MKLQYIVAIATFLISLILGEIAKKLNQDIKRYLPIQNLLIGVIVCVVEYILTKDFSLAIMMSGLTAGGTYDIISNLNKLNGDE